MKKGLKFWSKLLIVSFFLGGMATSAIAQNGRVTANCGKELVAVTRTVDQINAASGTEIPLKFTGVADGDKYYFVAASGASFTAITASCITDEAIGDNLTVLAPTATAPDANGVPSPAGTFSEDGQTINVKVKATNAVTGGDVLYLGVFVENHTTGCFSDVYWVRINVQGNIYAYLNLNVTDSNQYICNLGTTMDLGITLCNLPANGKFHYTVTATNRVAGAVVEGETADDLRIADVATGESGDIPLTPGTPTSTWTDIVKGEHGDASLNIGAQTLKNSSPNIAGELDFAFTKMVYRYKNDEGDSVVLPVKFIVNTECNSVMADSRRELYDSVFNVHVAPNFRVQALAFKTADERNAHSTNEEANTALTAPTFCQGTIAYFRAINTTTEGNIAYTWTPSNIELDATNIEAPTSKQLTSITLAYSSDVLATWNKDGKFGAGCTADTTINITITPAPILLLATDTALGEPLVWNTTDQITAPVVCPGQPVLIGTNETADFADDDAAARIAYMNAGNYIKANRATLSYTIDPLDNNNLKAYTDWRTTAAANGNLPLMQTGGTTPGHFLNNQTNAQANITYTVQNADPNGCALVKKDGSALNLDQTNEGQVKIIFPVQPRPQFQLGAN